MNYRITLACAIALAVSALWSCAETPVAPDQRGTSPSFTVERSSTWSSPMNLGSLVNSAATDQHPTLSKDGLTLYFASNRGTGEQNIWVARRACTDPIDPDCAWSDIVKLGTNVNSELLDASPALSRDEHQLFFASQRSNGHCSATPTAPCDRDLWVSYRDDVHNDFAWQPAVNLGPLVNTAGEEVAPSYFENDDLGLPQLFFNDGVINPAGALVLGNIYLSQLMPDGTWGQPSEVGGINTLCSDQRSSISHDGRELYFHSNRITQEECGTVAHIWVATRQQVGDPWSAPTQVPSPISDAQTIHPFIHADGKTESLVFVRGGDIWMSQRTRGGASD